MFHSVSDLTIIPVSKKTGSVVAEDIISSIQPHTCFISVMLVNNETGILQVIILPLLCQVKFFIANATICLMLPFISCSSFLSAN